MFLNHFDLKSHPFAEKPPIQWLLPNEHTDQALARLKFFKEQGAIAVIIGQTGLGKSSLLRLFIHDLPQNRYHPLYLHLTPLNANAFLRLIVIKLGEIWCNSNVRVQPETNPSAITCFKRITQGF